MNQKLLKEKIYAYLATHFEEDIADELTEVIMEIIEEFIKAKPKKGSCE